MKVECQFKKCLNTFDYKSNKKYCSRRCKQRAKDLRNPERRSRLQEYIEENFSYQKFKKDICESCNFKPVDKCQLDVDHIDGNHNNNDESNLQTLCANCHRLKTFNLQKFKESVLIFQKRKRE